MGADAGAKLRGNESLAAKSRRPKERWKEDCTELYPLIRTTGTPPFWKERPTITGQELNKRDGFYVWDTDKITITTGSDAKLLLMEVPMKLPG